MLMFYENLTTVCGLYILRRDKMVEDKNPKVFLEMYNEAIRSVGILDLGFCNYEFGSLPWPDGVREGLSGIGITIWGHNPKLDCEDTILTWHS